MDKECAYLDTLLQLMESYGYIAMFVAMALENANIPIPSEVVLGFAGFLISQQIFSFWTTFAVACIAGVVGSIISYWLGSYGGRPLLLKYGKYIFFNERKFRMAEDLFNKYGGIAVIICRCLPGVRTFISFPAGVARYPSGASSFSPSSVPSPGRCSSYGPALSWAAIGATSSSTTTSSSWPSLPSVSSPPSYSYGINAAGEM